MSVLIDAKTLAKKLGLTSQTVKKHAREGRYPCHRISTHAIRFDYEEVLAAIGDEPHQKEAEPETAEAFSD